MSLNFEFAGSQNPAIGKI